MRTSSQTLSRLLGKVEENKRVLKGGEKKLMGSAKNVWIHESLCVLVSK